MQNAESVDFSSNGIGPNGIAAMTVSLGTNGFLKALNLSGNGIGDEGVPVRVGFRV